MVPKALETCFKLEAYERQITMDASGTEAEQHVVNVFLNNAEVTPTAMLLKYTMSDKPSMSHGRHAAKS